MPDSLQWFLQICGTRLRFDLPESQQVMVLAPHPDDELLGCGGLLLHLLKKGAEVTVVYLTDGSGTRRSEQVRALRRQESAAVQELFGFRAVHLDAGEGELLTTDYCQEQLEKLIALEQPDLFLVPSIFDPHPDHRAANLLLAKNVDPTWNCAIYLYEIWSTHLQPNRYIDITEVMPLKLEGIASYASQDERYLLRERTSSLNAFRGSLTMRRKIKFAESFVELFPQDFQILCSLLL